MATARRDPLNDYQRFIAKGPAAMAARCIDLLHRLESVLDDAARDLEPIDYDQFSAEAMRRVISRRKQPSLPPLRHPRPSAPKSFSF